MKAWAICSAADLPRFDEFRPHARPRITAGDLLAVWIFPLGPGVLAALTYTLLREDPSEPIENRTKQRLDTHQNQSIY